MPAKLVVAALALALMASPAAADDTRPLPGFTPAPVPSVGGLRLGPTPLQPERPFTVSPLMAAAISGGALMGCGLVLLGENAIQPTLQGSRDLGLILLAAGAGTSGWGYGASLNDFWRGFQMELGVPIALATGAVFGSGLSIVNRGDQGALASEGMAVALGLYGAWVSYRAYSDVKATPTP